MQIKKINESQLREIISECVKKALSEIGDKEWGALRLGGVAGRSANRVNNSKTPEETLKHAKVVRDALNTFDKASVKNGERDPKLSKAFTKGLSRGQKLNELNTQTISNAFEKAFKKGFDAPDNETFNKRMGQAEKFRSELNNRRREIASQNNYPIIVVGGDLEGQYSKEEFEERFADRISGYFEVSQNPMYRNQKMIGYPKVRGYVGPMWDGGKIRYESPEVYDLLST